MERGHKPNITPNKTDGRLAAAGMRSLCKHALPPLTRAAGPRHRGAPSPGVCPLQARRTSHAVQRVGIQHRVEQVGGLVVRQHRSLRKGKGHSACEHSGVSRPASPQRVTRQDARQHRPGQKQQGDREAQPTRAALRSFARSHAGRRQSCCTTAAAPWGAVPWCSRATARGCQGAPEG